MQNIINIDELQRAHVAELQRAGLAAEKQLNVYKQIEAYKRTKSLKTAADIVENLKNYHILDHELYYKLLEDSQELQALKEKQRKSARCTNAKLTPKQLSERNRKAAIKRWNRVKANQLIQDIK